MYQLTILLINEIRIKYLIDDSMLITEPIFKKPIKKTIDEDELNRFLSDNSNSLQCHKFCLDYQGFINFKYTIQSNDYILSEYKVKIKKIK